MIGCPICWRLTESRHGGRLAIISSADCTNFSSASLNGANSHSLLGSFIAATPQLLDDLESLCSMIPRLCGDPTRRFCVRLLIYCFDEIGKCARILLLCREFPTVFAAEEKALRNFERLHTYRGEALENKASLKIGFSSVCAPCAREGHCTILYEPLFLKRFNEQDLHTSDVHLSAVLF